LNVRISVRNVRTKAFGILAFDGAKFKVYNVSKSDDVKEGDIFSTTEFSSQFPPDIPVIQVIYASRESEILFYDITGKPTADLNNVRYCLIGTNEFESNKIKFLTSDSEQ
jgi:cell shape-determining protein MreC